jgi:hypothetical protein
MAWRRLHLGHRAFKALPSTVSPRAATAATSGKQYIQVGPRAYQPTLPALPSLKIPPEQQLRGGKAMRYEHRDNDDLSPNRRTVRMVAGHRAYCPLRWCLRRHKERSTITVEHILAADELRRLADATAIGLSNGSRFKLEFFQHLASPSSGPSCAERKSVRAWRPFQRAMAIFTDGERDLVTHIVLLNTALHAFAKILRERGTPVAEGALTQPLVACLDKLVEHFRSEVDRAIQRGAEV